MPSSEERLERPGQPRVDAIDILSTTDKPIRLATPSAKPPMWGSITLTEDLFKPCIMGEVEVSDSVNLLQSFNLAGNERIHLKFSTPTLPSIDFEGYITKYSERINITDAAMIYKIKFVSPEAISSMTQKVRKGYCQQKYSDMARRIFDRYLADSSNGTKNLYIDPTLGLNTIAIPGWSPFQTMTKLAARSLDADPKYHNASYIFTERCSNGLKSESDPGGFFFLSLERLWRQSPIAAHYVYSPKNATTFEQGKGADDFYSVNHWTEKRRMDTAMNIKNGMYASRMVTHDLCKRILYQTRFDYQKNFEKTEHMNPGKDSNKLGVSHVNISGLTDKSISHEIYATKQQTYGGEPGTDPDNFNELDILKRNSLMQSLLSNQVIEINIPGDSSRRVGDMVKFTIPAPGKVRGAEGPPKDKYISGNYLVTAITHRILSDPNSYETVMELCKESSG